MTKLRTVVRFAKAATLGLRMVFTAIRGRAVAGITQQLPWVHGRRALRWRNG